MNTQKLFNIHKEIIQIVESSVQPADNLTAQYFRKNRFIGSKERKLISDLVYHYLRNIIFLKFVAKKAPDFYKFSQNPDLISLTIIFNFLICEFDTFNNSKLKPSDFFSKYLNEKNDFFSDFSKITCDLMQITDINLINSFLKKCIDELDTEINLNEFKTQEFYDAISIRYSVAPELLLHLKKTNYFRNKESALNFAKSSLENSKTHLRIIHPNENKTKVINFLQEQNIKYSEGKYSPSAIILEDRINLTNLDIYNKGFVEIQDETSQLITYALGLKGPEKVWDACAGAGGKTLHIFEMLNLKGSLIATDTEHRKLDELYNRMWRIGIKGIILHTIKPNDISALKKYELFDVILIDAPCTGSGTYKRNPQKVTVFDKNSLRRYADKQTSILNSYKTMLKPGGKLLYVTCSIFRDENEAVINKFLNQNRDFEGLPIKNNFDMFSISIPNLDDNTYCHTFKPEEYQSDGFFIALLQKKQ